MPRIATWSIQRRVVVVTAATLATALALGVAVFAVSLDRILYSAAQDTARTTVTRVATAIGTGGSTPADALAGIPRRGSVLQVIDDRGHVVATSDPRQGDRSMTQDLPSAGAVHLAQSVRVPGELGEPHAVVVEGVRARSGSLYAVAAAAPLELQSAVRSATILLSVGSLLLLVLVVGLVSRGVRRALDPVERIRTDVEGITRVRSHERITVPPSQDEVARLAVTMNRMLDRLVRSDMVTRQFVSDASHELRSPLASIRAGLEVAGDGSAAHRAGRDEVLLAETIRMQRLVEDLLTLAKADDGAPWRHDDVDLDELVDAEVRRLRATGVATVRARIEPVRVTGDEARLAQLLRNLVDNAARHATRTVVLSVLAEPLTAVIRVDNDGPPIPVGDREAVFGRFTRLDTARTRDRGGSGLGLAIVKSVAEAHDGTVVATQTDDGHCRFEVRLPLQVRTAERVRHREA